MLPRAGRIGEFVPARRIWLVTRSDLAPSLLADGGEWECAFVGSRRRPGDLVAMLRIWIEDTVFPTKKFGHLPVWLLRAFGGDWLGLPRNRRPCSEIRQPSSEAGMSIS